MRKELEALLLSAAKAIGYGVVGVDPIRAADWGVRAGVLVQAGEVPPGGRKPVSVAGYHCKTGDGQPTPTRCLTLDINGVGRLNYSLAELRPETTAHYSFNGSTCIRSLSEMKAYLRGIIDGATVRR